VSGLSSQLNAIEILKNEYGIFARENIPKNTLLCSCKPLLSWKNDAQQPLAGNCYDWAESLTKNEGDLAVVYEAMGGFWPRHLDYMHIKDSLDCESVSQDKGLSLLIALEVILLSQKFLNSAHSTTLDKSTSYSSILFFFLLGAERNQTENPCVPEETTRPEFYLTPSVTKKRAYSITVAMLMPFGLPLRP